jgi:hypothetical protein
LQQVEKPGKQLLRQGAVEAHISPDGLQLRRRHPRVAREHRVRPTRRELHEDERQDGDAEQERDRPEQAANEKPSHEFVFRRWARAS